MKLLIGVPCTDYVHAEFMKCLLKLTRKLNRDGIEYEIYIKSGALVYLSREAIASEAIMKGFTHILWLDSDMIFPDTIVDDLIKSGKSFVSGVYHSRHAPYFSCIFTGIEPPERVKEYPSDVFPIRGCGFGCVLVDMRIHRKVFQDYGCNFQPVQEYGEDLAFCNRVIKSGFEMWCDPNVQLGHIGHVSIYPDMASAKSVMEQTK